MDQPSDDTKNAPRAVPPPDSLLRVLPNATTRMAQSYDRPNLCLPKCVPTSALMYVIYQLPKPTV